MSMKPHKSVQPKDPKLQKYWCQRYHLFSRFDDGIKMDEESWYSVTPENIAIHIAERINKSLGDGYKLILDGFCGVGGNLIQFAIGNPFTRLIGVDICPERISMAKHNSKVYGVGHRCDLILGDFRDIVRALRHVDAIFLSPPWGGIDYNSNQNFSLSETVPNGFELMRLCRDNLSKNIAFFMPRNVDQEELKRRLLDKHNPLFEHEENMIGYKTKTTTAYFGDLVDQSSDTD